MNENPQSNWKQPLTGKRKWLAWFALFAVVLFVMMVGFAALSNKSGGVGELILLASLAAVIGAALLLLAIGFLRWLYCWRNLRRFAFGVACFVTLIALAYFEENVRGRSAWLKHKAAWEAKGEKFLIADLAPRPVPDEQNFALMPLLKPAMDYSRVNGSLVWNDTNGLARLGRLQADQMPVRETNKVLVLGSLEKGTLADLGAWREFYRGNRNYLQSTAPVTVAEEILHALGNFDQEMQELREAVVARPYARYPIEYGYEPSWGILLPHLGRLQGLTILTSVRATAELEAGRPAEALADWKAGFRLSDSIRDEPVLVDHLVRMATLSINLQTVREGLARHAWTDAHLVELGKSLGGLDLLAEYKLAMRGERALSASGLDWLRRQGFLSQSMMFPDGDGGAATYPGFSAMPSGWYYQNMLSISEMLQDFSIAAADEKAHRVFPGISEKGSRAFETMRAGPYTLFARLLLPALEKASRKSARMQVFVDAAFVACALERYRLANGALPETLAALTPRWLEQIPNDVMDGKLLRYRPAADGSYILYSVGWNETDEGGEVAWTKDKVAAVEIARGDWVWSMPAN